MDTTRRITSKVQPLWHRCWLQFKLRDAKHLNLQVNLFFYPSYKNFMKGNIFRVALLKQWLVLYIWGTSQVFLRELSYLPSGEDWGRGGGNCWFFWHPILKRKHFLWDILWKKKIRKTKLVFTDLKERILASLKIFVNWLICICRLRSHYYLNNLTINWEI